MDDRVVHHMKVEHKLVGRATNEREPEYKPCARSGATDENDFNRTAVKRQHQLRRLGDRAIVLSEETPCP
jgi:hypothetical protein